MLEVGQPDAPWRDLEREMREGMLEGRQRTRIGGGESPVALQRRRGLLVRVCLGQRPQPSPDSARRALLQQHLPAAYDDEHRDALALRDSARLAWRKLGDAILETRDAVRI